MKLEDIVSDEDMFRVHGNANFGATTPRQVLNYGVICCAVGYHIGSTNQAILKEHGLIKKNRDLTMKGRKYARALLYLDLFRL